MWFRWPRVSAYSVWLLLSKTGWWKKDKKRESVPAGFLRTVTHCVKWRDGLSSVHSTQCNYKCQHNMSPTSLHISFGVCQLRLLAWSWRQVEQVTAKVYVIRLFETSRRTVFAIRHVYPASFRRTIFCRKNPAGSSLQRWINHVSSCKRSK